MAERVYGADYDRMLKRQQGRCAGCGGRPRKKRLAIDHDHKTGKVRGLLCSTCNHDLLGVAERLADPVGTLRRLADYLAKGGVVGTSVGFAPRLTTLDLLKSPVEPSAAELADCPF
ncbi:MAG TPA: endonuclease domain-containing protein [Microbacterium sp.]|nr:endonuclease domain-containing protein [Microbacterium sp.]